MSLATTLAKIKLIPRDFGEPFQATVTGDGAMARFDLPVTNIDPASVVAKIGPTVLVPELVLANLGVNEYYLDPRGGVITLWTPLGVDQTFTVEGTAGLWSTPADMTSFIEIAFDLHARGRSPALTWDNITPAEEYALALYATREALWSEIAEHAHQVDVTTPEGMHIPGGQMFNQLMSMLDRIEAHYRELSGALNVGPYAIRMFTLRRISRTTNRLVPIYIPQEFDDHSTPTRVYPSIDTGSV